MKTPIYYAMLLLFCTGCMSQAKIDSILADCPKYVQENVGEIKYYPASWGTALMISGVTDKNTGEIWLTLWSDKHALLHEIGHSVYFRVPHDDFDKEFKDAKGFISIWALNHNEQVAEAFYKGMQGKSNPKIDCAMRFFNRPPP